MEVPILGIEEISA